MQPGPARRFLRSTVFRIALLNTALLALAMAAAGLGGWLQTRDTVEKAARERISIESNAIAVELRREGLAEARDAIRARIEQPGSLEYLLINANGGVIAGDMTSAPRVPGWHRLSLPASAPGLEGKRDILVFTTPLSGGAVLAVGDSLGEGEAVRKAVFDAIVVAGLVALLLGLVVGLVTTRRALRRMERIMTTVRVVEAGNLAARVEQTRPARDDIDELGAAMNAMLERIATLIATVRRVSAAVAHDLRTPLTRVRHALDAAADAPDQNARAAALGAARAGIDQALRLFDAVLELADIDSGEARALFTPVDLTDLAERVVDAYGPEIEGSGRTISLEANGPQFVQGDPDLLTRAIANLVDNALKHSREGARIAVRVAAKEVVVSVSVQDDGPGVKPDDVATMLRPFGRLDRARTTAGNGLGLAIVASIAELHGGEFHVQHLHPGLAVVIDLPRDPRSPSVR